MAFCFDECVTHVGLRITQKMEEAVQRMKDPKPHQVEWAQQKILAQYVGTEDEIKALYREPKATKDEGRLRGEEGAKRQGRR